MKDTVRVNFDFPKDEHRYLKMMCANLELSLKDYATRLLLRELEKYEDRLLAKKARKRQEESKGKETISWEQAKKIAGWGKRRKSTKSNTTKITAKTLKKSRKKIKVKSTKESSRSLQSHGQMIAKS